jgi:pyruvate decarboxylase
MQQALYLSDYTVRLFRKVYEQLRGLLFFPVQISALQEIAFLFLVLLNNTLKMTDIRTSALTAPIDVAEYLFTRLRQIGVKSIHGLPGDYNLVALDYVEKTGLKWVGNVNELNAGKCSTGIIPALI